MKEIRITPSPQEPTFREFRQHPERYPEQWRKLHRILQDLIPRLRPVFQFFRVLSETFRPGTVPGDIGLIVSGENRSEALLRLARRLPWTSARIRKALARRVEERGEEASLEDEEVRERAAALLLVLTMDEKEMERLRIPDEMTWSEFLRRAVRKEMERSVVEKSEAPDLEVDLEGLPDPQKELEEAEARLEWEAFLQKLWPSLTPVEQQLLRELARQVKESGAFSLTRAAQALGLSPNTGWTLWHRIRRKARQEGTG